MTDDYMQKTGLLLADVPADKVFNLKDGAQISSMCELYSRLCGMDDAVFAHHVTGERNDFSAWVRDVHKDYRLANSLSPSMSREEAISVVGKRLYELEKLVSSANCMALVTVPKEETASERLEKILSEAAKAKFDTQAQKAEKFSSSGVTATQLLAEEEAEEEPEQLSGILPDPGKVQQPERFLSEVSSIFSASTFSAVAKDLKGLLTRRQDDGLKFMQELSAFGSYSDKRDRKGEIISHLKKVYR
jgi:S-adenosylmethionine/arginine decarboxylase-like enzyme